MLKSGSRLRSQVCATEVIVVRASESNAPLKCGGHAMIDIGETPAADLAIVAGLQDGSLLGKRYTDDDATVEILVTKPGEGSLALGDATLAVKTAKPLPSSD
ncbi:hypothetical protein [Tomitella biformata]|uniref:hypothetical protein n=1 Tax=Tomitella biformata TaxID=630403 RepID=UPI0004679EFD|nr:hypothetical protein [Tomitella biformata]